ncbi:MAG: acylglycerol kinase family protein, partial [Aeriscardovia sp.]|nr:acylglycerol kinase family protein [Aeriscardovia sp.]
MDLSIPTTVIVNPASGSGIGEPAWEMLKEALKERGAQMEILFSSREEGSSLTDLARRATEKEGPMNLLVAGGDGSMQEVLAGIRDFSKVNLGALPTGSSNDFLRALGQRDPSFCVESILKAEKVHLRDGLHVTAWEESGEKKE